jgi:SAM-dependent methyltransferase
MTSTAQHSQVVQKQFGEQASAYLSSAVHAQGTEFALLQAELAGQGDARVLDLGCGAGHVSFHVAGLVKEVVAYDLSQQMLDVVAAAAADRGLSNVSMVNGAAERLPFADGEFDFVFSRYSAHHWSDLGLALSPGSPLFDTYLQSVEVLRDTSHVRDYSAGEWLRQISEAGLHTRSTTRQRLRLEYNSWVERMRTPQVMRAAIRELQQSMGNEVREYFEIEADGSFSTDVLVLFVER